MQTQESEIFMSNIAKSGKALVIGGSMAGMMTARVLSDFFAEVTIVDRDEFPEKPENRAGTPQAFHPHRWLPRGKIIMEKLFPSYTAELLANGAFSREGKILCLTGPYGTVETTDFADAGCSRALFEWVLRQRIKQIPNVRIISRQEVTSLQFTPDGTKVTGLHLRDRDNLANQTTLSADLVIDASGRTSKLPKWLVENGYTLPPIERLEVSLGYSTRHYKFPPHLADKWSAMLVEADPAAGIGTGAFGTIENGIAEMALYRAGGASYPTTDAARYEEEAGQLLTPAVAEVLRELEPLEAPRGFRVPECVRWHFEQAEKWPSGLLALGDAVCHFDPVFGQGMTVAAIEAEILGNCLAEQLSNPQPDFELAVFAKMQAAIEPAWWLCVGMDLRWAGVKYHGPLPMEGFEFAQRFLDLYLKQAYGPMPQLFEQFYTMTGLLMSPREIFNPAFVENILAASHPDEVSRFRADFLSGGQTLQEVIDRIIPSFKDAGVPFALQPV